MFNMVVQLNHITETRRSLKKIKSVSECFDILCGSCYGLAVFTNSRVTPCSRGHIFHVVSLEHMYNSRYVNFKGTQKKYM